MVLRRHLRLPLRLDHHRLVVLDNQRRPLDAVPGCDVGTKKHGRLVPAPMGEDIGVGVRLGRRCFGRKRNVALFHQRTAAHAFDLDRLDLDVLLRADEAEPLLVRDLEPGAHPVQRPGRDGERAVRAGVAEMGLRGDFHVVARDPLAHQLLADLCFQWRADLGERGEARMVESRQHGLRPRGAQGRETHAVGREHAGKRMEQHGF